jgi:muramoyltetrapeptide carboxypeptidase
MTQFGEYPRILDYTLEYFNKSISQEEKNGAYNIKSSELWTEEFLDWFKKEDETRARELKENSGHEWLLEGQAEGKLLGGAIPSVNHLAGTKYWCDPKQKIFFLDIPEGNTPSKGMPLDNVDSYLADLNNLGLFDNIKGLIIGRPYKYSKEQVADLKKVILKYVKEKNYPILYNVNMGHTDPIITLRYGSRIKLNSNQNLFSIIS